MIVAWILVEGVACGGKEMLGMGTYELDLI